jgi:hypothetical protein
MNKEHVFESDVDNQTGIKHVTNYMIGPVFPHSQPVEGDLFPKYEFNRSLPIGILQLINKKDHQKINDYDLQKFKAI